MAADSATVLPDEKASGHGIIRATLLRCSLMVTTTIRVYYGLSLNTKEINNAKSVP